MAEPETRPDEISLRAAEAAADVTEAERPQDRQRLAAAFTKAASSSARVAGRGTRAVGRRLGAARRGVGSGTSWLAAQVMAMAPRLRVRDYAALRQQFPGQSAEEIADALIEGASRASAAAGGAVGVWAALPTLPAFPAEVAAETLILVGIEIKLIAELHEVYGTPAPGNLAERMSAYVAAWAHRRGVFMIPGGLVLATGSPLARQLRRRLAARAGRSAFSLGPLLTGAAAGAYLNSRETRRLAHDVRRDLRRNALPGWLRLACDAFLGVTRFDDFQARLGISRNILTQRLNRLIEGGILKRVPYSDHPPRSEYRLTGKGRDLWPVVTAMRQWGDRWAAPGGPPVETRHIGCGHIATAVPTCSHCGEPLDARSVIALPGPGASPGDFDRTVLAPILSRRG